MPLVGRDVDGYAAGTGRTSTNTSRAGAVGLTMLDPAPRVVLDPELGMLTVGPSARDAGIAADIYHHTMTVIERGEDRSVAIAPCPLPTSSTVEYWELEQAKLRRAGPPGEFPGRVALVTGAASGIGRACAAELLARGAAWSGSIVDDESMRRSRDRRGSASLPTSRTSARRDAVRVGVERFGGIDIAVIAAGIFGATRPVAELDAASGGR